jgi:hypothetical protein
LAGSPGFHGLIVLVRVHIREDPWILDLYLLHIVAMAGNNGSSSLIALDSQQLGKERPVKEYGIAAPALVVGGYDASACGTIAGYYGLEQARREGWLVGQDKQGCLDLWGQGADADTYRRTHPLTPSFVDDQIYAQTRDGLPDQTGMGTDDNNHLV